MVPIVSIQAQLVAIPAQMVEVAAAITAVAESKFPGITIEIPALNPNFCTIP